MPEPLLNLVSLIAFGAAIVLAGAATWMVLESRDNLRLINTLVVVGVLMLCGSIGAAILLPQIGQIGFFLLEGTGMGVTVISVQQRSRARRRSARKQ